MCVCFLMLLRIFFPFAGRLERFKRLVKHFPLFPELPEVQVLDLGIQSSLSEDAY